MAFNRDYLDDYLDTLWELRENISMDLDWGYECRLNRMCEQVRRQLIDPHVADKQRRSCEFAYTTCVQNLETCRENLEGLRDTVRYLFEQSPEDHPSTHAHYQDILYSIENQEKGLLHIQAVFRSHL